MVALGEDVVYLLEKRPTYGSSSSACCGQKKPCIAARVRWNEP